MSKHKKHKMFTYFGSSENQQTFRLRDKNMFAGFGGSENQQTFRDNYRANL